MVVSPTAPPLIGTAGWTIPGLARECVGGAGSQLERYAQHFSGVEVNSCFYRPHRPTTYARWAESVPASFRFVLKVPKSVTHELRLGGAFHPLLDAFLEQSAPLGRKLGALLIQLPPSLAFDRATADDFFGALRERFEGGLACEPRHASWFATRAEALLRKRQVARVAADPAVTEANQEPGGFGGLIYRRLHGSPRKYFSSYGVRYLRGLARRLEEDARRADEVICIFDNTGGGHALMNAWSLQGWASRAGLPSRSPAVKSSARAASR